MNAKNRRTLPAQQGYGRASAMVNASRKLRAAFPAAVELLRTRDGVSCAAD